MTLPRPSWPSAASTIARLPPSAAARPAPPPALALRRPRANALERDHCAAAPRVGSRRPSGRTRSARRRRNACRPWQA